ncbi:MAG TPA: carbohydrate ABC transporter permease [Symbiobacteriaceae bacterium]|nr:carbohydrate ABC transporter permease [Symbiobacteriaceae bacterium]
MRKSRIVLAAVLYPIYTIAAVLILYPVVWMIYSSFKSNMDILSNVFALPRQISFENYVTVFTTGGLGRFFANSLFISSVSVAGLILFSAMAAYAFATFEFRGKKALFLFCLIGMMVPTQSLIISGFKWMSVLKLVNTYWALIFTYLGWGSFGIQVLRNFFQSVPKEVKEAALIDGAGHWHMFTKIMLPLARPSISTVTIFYFMWVWNEFIYPLVYMQEPEKFTVPLGILFFNDRYNVDWGLQMAGLAVATIPPLIVYYTFQKQFIRGILAGAVKG